MKRILITSAVIIGLLAGMLIAIPPAQAERPFTGATIKGTYYFLVTETRDEPTPVDPFPAGILHCETHGNAVVFPDGTMEICGPTMCNGVPTAGPEPGSFTYVIAGDEILITEVDPVTGPAPDSTHCKILDNGKIWLCDGGQRTIDELWTWAGTIVKVSPSTDDAVLADCFPLPLE